MTTLHKLFLVAGTTFAFCAAPSPAGSLLGNAGGDDQNTPVKTVEMSGTHLLTLHSSITGEDFNLYVSFPRNYQDTTKRFPVLYLLDGQYDFTLMNGIYGDLYYDGFLPELITVGITWGEHPNIDSLRARDLTPTTIKQLPWSGHAPAFLAAIKEELIPYVEARYRTDRKDRTLMGSSLGGLFTLYAMFHETELFTRYVLTSPSLGWDNNVVYTYEESYHTKHTRLPVSLFMAYSEFEGIAKPFGKLVDQLKSRNYRDLQMETRVLEGMGHAGSKPEGYTRGLQSVFARPTTTLDPSKLAALAGRYRLNPELALSIEKANDHIVLIAPDSTRIDLLSDSDSEFYVKGSYLFLKFQKNPAGTVTGLHVQQFGGGLDLVKEK